MTELTKTFIKYKNELAWDAIKCAEELDNKLTDEEIIEIENIYNSENEANQIEEFCVFASIETVEDLIKLGDIGVQFGCCNTAYDNLYRIARKCFKGRDCREEFSSSTLYYFWQSLVMGTGRLMIVTSKGDEIIAEAC